MKRNTVHKRAQRAVSTSGERCNRCGSTSSLQRHHDDYTKPDQVEILCAHCHVREHHLLPLKECLICKSAFRADRSRRTLCGSEKCRAEWGRRCADRRWTGHTRQRKCEWCETVFVYSRARQSTCSRSCSSKLAWSKRRRDEQTSSVPSATAWSLWLSQQRGALSALESREARDAC